MPYDWDQVIASTKPYWLPFIAQGVYESDVLFRVLFRRDKELTRGGRMPQYYKESGGTKIVWSAVVAKPTVQTVYGYEVLNTIQPNQFRSVELPFAHYVTSVSIDKDTEDANVGAGDRQVFDLVEALMDNARQAIGEQLATDIYADGSAPDAARRIVPLQVSINNNNTYATVTRGSNTTWWNSKVVKDAANADIMLQDLNRDRIELSDASQVPDLIITSRALFNKLWGQALPSQQLGERDDPTIGWEHISLGKTKITWSKYCPDSHVYYLHLPMICVHVHRNAEFEFTDEIQSPNQLAWVRFLRWKGQLVVVNPVWQGRRYNYNTN